MISRTVPTCQIPEWHGELARCITDPAELLEILGLPRALLPGARTAAETFSLKVPRRFVALMHPGDIADPLLRQVLPLGDELIETAGYANDPLNEQSANLGGGLLRKYRGRVLIIASPVCALHCRYCFRRSFPYSDNLASRGGWRASLENIRQDQDLGEVILSGGDPLSLDDARLARLVTDLESISHLKRLRIHTRLPVVLPQRISEDLNGLFANSRLQCVMVLHCNHPRELTVELKTALEGLASHVTLLNQSVLLRGVNDDVGVLAELSERLFDCHILPYYIHFPDQVRGTAHFDITESRARRLMTDLRARLPGYLVPRLVRELPGMASKQPVV